jgi:hypothetical protein
MPRSGPLSDRQNLKHRLESHLVLPCTTTITTLTYLKLNNALTRMSSRRRRVSQLLVRVSGLTHDVTPLTPHQCSQQVELPSPP